MHAYIQQLRALFSRMLANRSAPIVVLSLILVFSLYARVADLSAPCSKPCRTPGSHTLIFDESYYVNAARVIDGINPPAGASYHNAPKGKDPNAEHPQLAKLVIAGTIKLFGNTPLGWRVGSVLFGLIALAALYARVADSGWRWAPRP
jgi:dolichyl-phosphate-mannose-protein mannosyltransferase